MFVIADRYHVIAPLGAGGMGAVYEAIHTGTGRRVAVKVLLEEIAQNPRSRERFVREARLAGALSSPHVAEVLDAGTDEASQLPFLVMELLEGPNLREVIQKRSQLPVGLVLVIAAHIASGLSAAHEAGVIHRDIKPSNVVLCSSPSGRLVAKIVDFGVAKAVEDREGSLTQTGDVVGSLQYVSPEQLAGARVSGASDIWSLGALMYEAMSGSAPCGNENLAALFRKLAKEEITPLVSVAPFVPHDVAALVHRALAVDPAKRFASARAMHDAICALLPAGTEVPSSVLADGSEIPVRGRARTGADWRQKTKPLAVAIGIAAIATTAVAAIARSNRTDPMFGPPIGVSPAQESPVALATAEPREDEPAAPNGVLRGASADSEAASSPASSRPATTARPNLKPPVRPAPATPPVAKLRDPRDHM